ncbi:MAG: hypothetical protein Q4B68_10875 [Bacteroidales bacterium]|nr:hypothetical protein [Bacteroidales bacterium]
MKTILRNLCLPIIAIALMAMAPQKSWAQDVASVTIAGATSNYTSINDAFAAAMAADTATLKLLANVELPQTTYLVFTSGKVTLDLNGKCISASSSSVITLTGGQLFITDFTEAQEGKLQNSGGNAVYASYGTLAINAGTYIAPCALNTTSYANVSLSGGRFKGSSYAIYTMGKSGLASNCCYYDAATGDELFDYTDMPIANINRIVANDVIVKRVTAKAIVTIDGEETGYLDVSQAITDAKNAEKATVKLLANYKVQNGYGLQFEKGNVTLDLNGKNIATYYAQSILVNGGTLTIIDSSEGQGSKVDNKSGYCLKATSGTLNVAAGTFTAPEGNYLTTPASGKFTGGRFTCDLYSSNYALFTSGFSALAPGYAYFDPSTGDLLEDSQAHPVFQKDVDSPALDITVRRVEVPTAITDVTAAAQAKAVKMIENGQVVIIKDGKRFNITGAEIK